MGYCVSLANYDFEIKKENIKKALDAINKCPELKIDTPYETIEDALAEELDMNDIGYDKEGNINNFCWNGEKLRDQEYAFKAIAPFLVSGSFLEYSGEEGTSWRWVSKDGKFFEISPKWEMP